MNFTEFENGLSRLSMSLSTKKAKKEFDKMDKNSGGVVLFDEFCVFDERHVVVLWMVKIR